MDEKTLMMRLHLNNMRQGPGSDDATNLALNMAGIDRSLFYRVADIGCGTGAQTIALAASLKGEIVAVDLFEEFLAKLEKSCSGRALSASVSTVVASMDDLPFEREEFDIVWSEPMTYSVPYGTLSEPCDTSDPVPAGGLLWYTTETVSRSVFVPISSIV